MVYLRMVMQFICFMRSVLNTKVLMQAVGVSDVVDIFNSTGGTWSVSRLSTPRDSLAATSLLNHGLALFAGGYGPEGESTYIVVHHRSHKCQVYRIASTFSTC